MTPTDGANSDAPTAGAVVDAPTDTEADASARRARLRTSHDDPAVVAGAIAPDNTDQMMTSVTGEQVVTTVERQGTGGLQSTVDDYLVNLQVADAVAGDATSRASADCDSTHSQPNDATDTNTNDT